MSTRTTIEAQRRGIRLLRERAGKSISRLASEAGITSGGLCMIESGRRASPRPTTIESIAKALGVDPVALVLAGTEEADQ